MSYRKDTECQITTVLPIPLMETLSDICDREDRNRSQIVRTALRDWISKNLSTEQDSSHVRNY
jgi:metal-responsive CopG/Arc/MetJ family transcriptional regulator